MGAGINTAPFVVSAFLPRLAGLVSASDPLRSLIESARDGFSCSLLLAVVLDGTARISSENGMK